MEKLQSPFKKDLRLPVTNEVSVKSTRPLRKALTAAALSLILVFFTHAWILHKPRLPGHHRRLTLQEREALYLSVTVILIVSSSHSSVRSIPSSESALEASRAYATHPHLGGSSEDLLDAKTILHLLQDELGIHKPLHLPIYKAGSASSRNATLLLTDHHAPGHPTAWIDTYFPVMNTGLKQSLDILDSDGNLIWSADLVEDGDPRDEDAHKYRDTIPAWHGLSADGDVTGQLVYANYGGKEVSLFVSQQSELPNLYNRTMMD